MGFKTLLHNCHKTKCCSHSLNIMSTRVSISEMAQRKFLRRRETTEERVDKYLSGGCRLLLDNLHFQVDSEDLKSLFSIAGPVKKAVIFHDKNGRPLGSGEVVLALVVDAFRAMRAFNGILYRGRRLRITCAGRDHPEEMQAPKRMAVKRLLPLNLSKEDLDRELDEYMKRRKTA